MTDAAVGSKAWQGEVINGKFRLGAYLGGSQHSSVFVAEYEGPHPKRAVKIVPVREAEPARVGQIEAAARLTHAHLLPIVDTGYCNPGGTKSIYVVMEYAEEDLSLILPERALTEQETRDMLRPLVEVLAFLHGAGRVHGAVKPSNIMASGDCLKLSADTICAAGERAVLPEDSHAAPELRNGNLTPAADIWSLGVTIHEVLTQQLPQWQGEQLVVSDTLPFPFPQLIRRCLARDPAQRWNVADIAACLAIGKQSPAHSSALDAAPLRRQRIARAAGMAILFLVVIWLLLSHRGPKTQTEERPQSDDATTPSAQTLSTEPKPSAAQPVTSAVSMSAPPAVTSEPPLPPPASEPCAEAAPPTLVPTAAGSVVRQVLPDVPRKAMNTITGKFRNSVRVSVDPSGNVTDARMESAGPSRYFAKFSEDAARQWHFAPQDVPTAWVLSFEFHRDGVSAKASQLRR